jgi:hypothetical protein
MSPSLISQQDKRFAWIDIGGGKHYSLMTYKEHKH